MFIWDINKCVLIKKNTALDRKISTNMRLLLELQFAAIWTFLGDSY